MHLAIAGEKAIGPNQASRVEDMPGIAVIALEKAAGLDENAVLSGLLVVAVGVLVGNGDRQAVRIACDGRSCSILAFFSQYAIQLGPRTFIRPAPSAGGTPTRSASEEQLYASLAVRVGVRSTTSTA